MCYGWFSLRCLRRGAHRAVRTARPPVRHRRRCSHRAVPPTLRNEARRAACVNRAVIGSRRTKGRDLGEERHWDWPERGGALYVSSEGVGLKEESGAGDWLLRGGGRGGRVHKRGLAGRPGGFSVVPLWGLSVPFPRVLLLKHRQDVRGAAGAGLGAQASAGGPQGPHHRGLLGPGLGRHQPAEHGLLARLAGAAHAAVGGLRHVPLRPQHRHGRQPVQVSRRRALLGRCHGAARRLWCSGLPGKGCEGSRGCLQPPQPFSPLHSPHGSRAVFRGARRGRDVTAGEWREKAALAGAAAMAPSGEGVTALKPCRPLERPCRAPGSGRSSTAGGPGSCWSFLPRWSALLSAS